MRKIIVWLVAALGAGALALGLNVNAAQAQPAATAPGVEFGPMTVCKAVTFFDFVLFEYDCYSIDV
jgi:hypothetical protein